jgi:hypothetical protein
MATIIKGTEGMILRFIHELLTEGDQLEATARRLVTATHKPNNWVELWRHCSERARDKRQHAEATAARSGIDFSAAVQVYLNERGATHAEQRSA